MKIIRYADLFPQPWKNGGGVTREIATFPEGAGFDDFGWRLSIADVASDGPFSIFEGVDRTLVLLDGAGVNLRCGSAEHRLRAQGDMAAFDGGAATASQLVSGSVRDFNVMTRRSDYQNHVELRGSQGSRTGSMLSLSESSQDINVLFLLEDQRISANGRGLSLERLDAIFLESGDIGLTHAGIALHIRLTALLC